MNRVRIVLARHDSRPVDHSDTARRMVREHADRLGLPCDVRVRNTDCGAPYLDGTSKHVSLSHDRNWVAAATSSQPVGVDVQRVEPCTQRFRSRIGCDTDRGASRSWCIREAIAKLRGKGLADAPWLYELDDTGRYEEAYWFCAALRDDTFLAVATFDPATVSVEEVTDDDPSAHALSARRRLAAV